MEKPKFSVQRDYIALAQIAQELVEYVEAQGIEKVKKNSPTLYLLYRKALQYI